MCIMKIKSTQYNLTAVLEAAPLLKEVIAELDKFPHVCYETHGVFLAELISEELFDAPMMVVRSKRMTDEWRAGLFYNGPKFCIDGLARRGMPRAYWAWEGPGLSLAFKVAEVIDPLCSAYETELPLLVVWIAENIIHVDELTLSQPYLDTMSEVFQVAQFPRFVPDESYVNARLAELPPPLATNEDRFVGEEGQPIYIVRFAR